MVKALSFRDILSKYRSLVTSCGVIITATFAIAAHAEETALIKIRTISAHKIHADGSGSLGAQKTLHQLPASLKDISQKLEGLSFDSFKLQAQDEVPVGLKDLKEVRLVSQDPRLSAQTLRLKLLGLNRGKVCLWINWRESEGEEILDSRVHFKQGEQFITGTEGKDGVGMLVVLQVTKQD